MAKKFLTPINVTNLSSDPVSANEGDIYYNTASDALRVYANGSWSNVSSGGAAGVTSVTGTANEVDVSASTGAVTISLPATINANTTGTAASLTTARAIALSGDVSGSANFDGSASAGITTTLANTAVTPDTYGSASAVGTITIDSKGRVTGASNTAIAIAQSAVNNLTTDLSAKSPLASPIFTGIPAAPTAAADTNTTQIATTAYVVGQGYLKSTTAASTYLTQSSASSTYLTQSNAGSTYAPLNSPTFTGTVTVPTPTVSTAAATKAYVDNIAQGLHTHAPCAAATPNTLASITGGTVTYNNGTNGVGATLTLQNALTTLDGRTLQNGDRILVKNEATAANNGIYTWATGGTVLTRASDYDTPTEMAGGDFTFVQNGTLYNDTGWVMTDPVITVGTTAVNFVQFSGAGTYTAGTGLALNGTQFSNTGVLSLAGTTNEITVSASTGSITLSIPAAIARLASPTFTGTPAAPTAAVDTNTTQIATTAFVVGQGYAKLASPALSGTPTAPTAAVGTNTTQVATTAFVIGQANSTAGTITMNGTQAAGSSNLYARADHVHATDTSRAADTAVVHIAGTETITGAKSFSNAIKVDSATAAAQALQFWNAASFFGSIGTDQSLRGSGTSTDLALRADTGRAIRFMTNGANERMVIDSAGNVAIGLTSTSVKLNVSGTTWLDQASGDTVVRAQGLTVGFTPASNYTLDSDPGDSLRNTALISKGATRPVVLTLRNADNASSFWDIIADGNTNKFFIRRTNGTGTALTVDVNQNVGINTTSPAFKLEVNGSFAATTKSFVIDHPTRDGMKLRYGSLEGPENGVYVRGKTRSSIITLPDYWTGLVDEDSITVQLTPYGKRQRLYVKNISDNTVEIGGVKGEFYYFIQAERKDVDKLVVEYDI